MEQQTASSPIGLDAGSNFVLEPLSQATKTVMSPLELSSHDHLYLWIDPSGRKFVAELRSMRPHPDTGVLVERDFPKPSFAAEGLFNRLPEVTWLGRGDPRLRYRWTVAATDFTALVLHHCWPADRLHFKAAPDLPESDEARDLYTLLLKRFAMQNARAATAAAFKLTKAMPAPQKDWLVHPERPLADYQVVATALSIDQPGYALFMDRGTGKTPCVIQRICQEAVRLRRTSNEMYRALVVCPPQVRLQWQDEIESFATTQGKVVVVRGGQVTRLKKLIHGITSEDDCAFSVVVIAYDSLVSSIDHFARVHWDLVVADESHFFKSPSTDRWDAMSKLRHSARARMGLTGTPIGNSLMDLWSQLEFLGDGLSGFQSYKAFRAFHGVWQEVDGGHESGVARLLAVKNIALLQERLARLTFTITKEEAGLNLPDKVYDLVEVEMTKEQADIYNKVATQLAIEIEDKLSGDVNNLTIEHILTSLLRLAQITSGFVSWDPVVDPDTGNVLRPRRIEQINAANPKAEALVELLTAEDRDPLGKTIVWCCFVEDIKRIGERLTQLGIKHGLYYGATSQNDRDAIVAAFNSDPEFKVIVANPQTAGEGLNLIGYDKRDPENSKTYCDMEVFFSQNWSSILRSQAEDRAHRRGTRMPVRVVDLTVPDTIDEEIRRRVRSKQTMASTVLEIRDILRSVLGGLPGTNGKE